MPDNDPIALLYKEVGEQFSGNSLGMIAIETDNVVTKEALEQVKQITDTLLFADGVSAVTSITNIFDLRGDE